MSDNLEALEDWLGPLIRKLEPSQRRRLARDVARDLRRERVADIKAQRNPDGSAFAPRKRQRGREAAGSIRRRAMFRKIRLPRYLKAKGTPNEALVSFTGNAARIARVHQYGQRDTVNADGTTVEYPERRLLGFRRTTRESIRDRIINHLAEP